MFPDAGFGSLSLSPLGVFSSAWENGRTDGGGSAPHGMEGCAALLDKRRASGAATFLSDRDRAAPGSEQSSSCSRERESKVGAESREEFLGRRRGRQVGPGSRRNLPGGGAPHCRLLEAPGPPTTTSPSPIRATSSLWPLQQRQTTMTTTKSKT